MEGTEPKLSHPNQKKRMKKMMRKMSLPRLLPNPINRIRMAYKLCKRVEMAKH